MCKGTKILAEHIEDPQEWAQCTTVGHWFVVCYDSAWYPGEVIDRLSNEQYGV